LWRLRKGKSTQGLTAIDAKMKEEPEQGGRLEHMVEKGNINVKHRNSKTKGKCLARLAGEKKESFQRESIPTKRESRKDYEGKHLVRHRYPCTLSGTGEYRGQEGLGGGGGIHYLIHIVEGREA